MRPRRAYLRAGRRVRQPALAAASSAAARTAGSCRTWKPTSTHYISSRGHP